MFAHRDEKIARIITAPVINKKNNNFTLLIIGDLYLCFHLMVQISFFGAFSDETILILIFKNTYTVN